MQCAGQIERVRDLDQQAFQARYVATRTPVVIEGALAGWPASQKWNLAYLSSVLGDSTITLRHSRTKYHPDLFTPGAPKPERRQVEIREFLELLYSGRARDEGVVLAGDLNMLLSGYDNVDAGLAPLAEDLEVPPLFDAERLRSIGIWMSPSGIVAPLHYDRDGSHNLNAQVQGEKRAVLVSPRHLLAPFSAANEAQRDADMVHFSSVCVDDIETSELPAFRAASYVETILTPGDLLFIPSYWWHSLYHRGAVNINVTFWWAPEELELTRTSFRQQLVDLVVARCAPSDADRVLGSLEDAIGRMQLP